ncbi:ATP-grasp domain-containing protein [Oscillospiraceae bacterium 21-37]
MNILLSSAGRRGYLAEFFKETLRGEGKVFVGNSDIYAAARAYADEFVMTPPISSDEYIPFLLNYCLDKDIRLIVPLFDPDVLVLSKNCDVFAKKGIQVLVSKEEAVETCNDKWRTYQFCIKNQIHTPKTFLRVEDAKMSLSAGEVNFPVVIKPRWGMGSIGVYQADNMIELEILFLKCSREMAKTYIKSFQNDDHVILIQEKLSGTEFGVDIINDLEGTFCCDIIKRKYRMRAGETDCAILEYDQKIDKLARYISERLGHIANLDADFFVEKDECYLLEMNARFGGGYPFSHMAGINLPAAIMKWIKGESITDELSAREDGFLLQKDIRLVSLPNDGEECDGKK